MRTFAKVPGAAGGAAIAALMPDHGPPHKPANQ